MSSLYAGAILPDGVPSSLLVHNSTALTPLTSAAARPFTPSFVQRQLQLPPANAKSKAQARALYDSRVHRRQLIIATKIPPTKNRDRSADDDDDKRMGRREAAEKGLWRLRSSEARWELFVPLHRLWCGYMSELLGLASAGGGVVASASASAMPQAAGMHAKLVKADFHGSIVSVRRSRNAALVGAGGIVVQETENTFKVVTRNDKLKVLPKQGSVFVFAVPLYRTGSADQTDTVLDGPHVEFELYGNQFCFRAADRAGRKFKHKESIEL